ncbi:uncharacterized protein EDB93DRAFT_1257150 [Suillus bovinus]|uniref:uncharacterized protein n=1 Tax=Suillus bovinus TaxID=48563 RepID=UPI001B884F46|nr:uncharacterized protein EDB93DRAFT_1257150 [Suillus bovinus]KAG2127194.1 hypothetical protein EDB93DRAFT_1257150 [Suillus bovinus]
MQPNIFTAAVKQVTKLTDKAKAALEERLEASGPSKKRMIDANGASAVSNKSKKAKQNPPADISKDRLVAEASPPPSDVRTAAEPRKICCVIVRTEEEEEALYNNAIVIDDMSEKSGDEAGSEASGPESAEDERTRLMKEWVSPVYAFFDPTPRITEVGGRRAHEFKCCAKGCKVTIRQFLDKKDARLTGNMRKHVKSCWGEDALNAADNAKDADEVRAKIVGSILKKRVNCGIFRMERKGEIDLLALSAHTAEMVCWVSESLRPFEIVKDWGFQSLMKTGRPEYYIPSPSTISRDVRLVFARTHQRVAKMLQEYDGKINFTTDAWSSPNHRAFVVFSVHLEHKGIPLSLPLDIIEVAKSADP